MSAHTIPEQLRELAGARQLAMATFTRTRDPELRHRASRLLADIRVQRRQLHRQLLADLRAAR